MSRTLASLPLPPPFSVPSLIPSCHTKLTISSYCLFSTSPLSLSPFHFCNSLFVLICQTLHQLPSNPHDLYIFFFHREFCYSPRVPYSFPIFTELMSSSDSRTQSVVVFEIWFPFSILGWVVERRRMRTGSMARYSVDPNCSSLVAANQWITEPAIRQLPGLINTGNWVSALPVCCGGHY